MYPAPVRCSSWSATISCTLVVHMRSNDVFMGFPHDVFAFTMIQEILANDLGVKLGIV